MKVVPAVDKAESPACSSRASVRNPVSFDVAWAECPYWLSQQKALAHGEQMNDRTCPDPRIEPTVSLERAGVILGISRGSAYNAAEAGQIPVIKLGVRLWRVPTAWLQNKLGLDLVAS